MLQYLISDTQAGYMEGRSISLNIRRMIDLLQYVEREQIPALLITVDFHKCFDSISFEAIQKAMLYFNFGPTFVKYVMMLYNVFQTNILQNGMLSTKIRPQRGIHQGCSVSGYLFLLVAEILAIELKANKTIKGIPLPVNKLEKELILQFVDDTALCILFCEESLQEVVNVLETFYQNTGLKANYEKTMIYRLGSAKRQKKLNVSATFKWTDGHIDMLGVILDSDRVFDNYVQIVDKVEGILQTWKIRHLTLMGKVTMLNSLIGSLFVYRMQVLPSIDTTLVARIVKIIQEFTWNGRKPKLRYEMSFTKC